MSILYSNTSITHTYGNIACVALNYVKNLFSEDFFNTVHISTRMAYRQLDIFRTRKEFWKRRKPMLILRPRIELDDSSKYFYGSAMTNRQHNSMYRMEYANTEAILEDRKHGTMIRYGWNREKIIFDVVIIVDTMNTQINLAHSLYNRVVPNTPFFIHAPLESYLPKNIVLSIADYLGIERTNTADILKYMNTESKIPITYKMKNSSGNNEFFCLYDTNIEAILSDISIDDGNEKGMLQDTFTISFSFACEFYSMANYYLFLRDGKELFNMCPPDKELTESDQERVQPLYSIPLLLNVKLDEGWKIYSSPSYIVPHGVDTDETDLSQLITEDLKLVIKYQQKINIPLHSLIRFKVFRGIKELPYGEDGFEVDMDKFILTTYDCAHKETYRLFIIVNNLVIQNYLAEITDFNKET